MGYTTFRQFALAFELIEQISIDLQHIQRNLADFISARNFGVLFEGFLIAHFVNCKTISSAAMIRVKSLGTRSSSSSRSASRSSRSERASPGTRRTPRLRQRWRSRSSAAIWWAYFDFTAAVLARVLANRPPEERGPLARDVFTLCHYPIVLGIILFAVAAKKTVAHPDEPLSGTGRFALAGGIAMFLIGFALGRYRIVRHVAYERVGAAVAAIVAVLVFPDLDALALMAIVVGVLVAGLAWEAVHMRAFRAEVRAGPTQN